MTEHDAKLEALILGILDTVTELCTPEVYAAVEQRVLRLVDEYEGEGPESGEWD